jgi:hypothetical protein
LSVALLETFGRRATRSKSVPPRDVEPPAHPQIDQRVDVRPADERRNDPFIGDGDCELRGAEFRRNGRAVPEPETDVERNSFADVGKQPAQGLEAFVRTIHSLRLQAVQSGTNQPEHDG